MYFTSFAATYIEGYFLLHKKQTFQILKTKKTSAKAKHIWAYHLDWIH